MTNVNDTMKKEGVGHKVKVNGYSHKKADVRKDKRRQEAEERQAKYDLLTLDQKIQQAKTNSREWKRLMTRKNRPAEKTAVIPHPAASEPVVKKINKYRKVKRS